MDILFKEEQRFSQTWLWIILLAVEAIPLYGIYQQIYLGETFGNNPLPDAGLIAFAVFTTLLLLAFLNFKLKTRIDKNEIHIWLFPFANRKIKLSQIKSLSIVNYGFVGGWGIRTSSKWGTIYNTKGATGLAMELDNGEKICIGTQKETELKRVIESLSSELYSTSRASVTDRE